MIFLRVFTSASEFPQEVSRNIPPTNLTRIPKWPIDEHLHDDSVFIYARRSALRRIKPSSLTLVFVFCFVGAFLGSGIRWLWQTPMGFLMARKAPDGRWSTRSGGRNGESMPDCLRKRCELERSLCSSVISFTVNGVENGIE